MSVIKLSRVFALAVVLFAFAGLAQANSGDETIATASPFDWSSFSTSNYASAAGVIAPYDVDYYMFQVNQAGTVVFQLTSDGGVALQSPRIDLFDPSGTLIAGENGQSLDETLNAGVYYPRVSSASDGLGTYVFTVTGAAIGSSAAAQIGGVTDPAPEPNALVALAIGSIFLGACYLLARRKLHV